MMSPVPPPPRPAAKSCTPASQSGSDGVTDASTPKSYLSQSQYSLSQSSHYADDEAWYSQLFLNRLQNTPLLSHERQNRRIRRSSTFNSDDLAMHAPSPSDSGIAELESLLREKESEISFLRETLEQNEQVNGVEKESQREGADTCVRCVLISDLPLLQVIIKVYEEKEQCWQKEYMKLRSQYESSLLLYQKKALKAEEQLLLVEQQVRTNFLFCCICIHLIMWTKQGKEEKARTEKEVHDLKNSNLFLEKKLADMSLEMGRPDQVTESESGQEQQDQSLDHLSLPAQLHSTIHMLQLQVQDLLRERKSAEALAARLKQENQDLRYEAGNVREEVNTLREGIAEEREQWQREKQKVLRYQKQLNQNYILVLKRNKEIESDFKAFRDKSTYKFITDETKC